MPEILEIEMYRRAASAVVGRRICSVESPDAWYLKKTDANQVADALLQRSVVRVDRIGKLMLLDVESVVVGLRFGMTGRLVIDGDPTIDKLEYSSKRLDPAWNRFSIAFDDGGSLVMNDQRRLGGVELDPDLSKLGIDAWTLDGDVLHRVAQKRTIAIKALLLNQKVVAGLGNLLVDELLWRVGIDPNRPAKSLTADECGLVALRCASMLPELYEQGGSHTGDLFAERGPEGRCPRDGSQLRRAELGGRTTWWCPQHQQ